MISLDPSERPTFDTLLHTSRGTVFPESFYSFLHNYIYALPSDSDHRLERIWADYESIEPYITPEKVEADRSETEVKIEYIPPVISTSRPFEVSSCFIHSREHYSNSEYDTRTFFL